MSAPGVSNVTSRRHVFCCGRNCARGLLECRKTGVRGCWDPRAVRRWQMGGGTDGHSSAGPLRRTRPRSGSAGFDRNARPLTTVASVATSVALAEICVTAPRSHDWSFHAVDRRVHPLARSASRDSRRRHTHDSPIATQPPIQPRPTVARFAACRNSVHAHLRFGRIATSEPGLGEQRMAQCRVQGVRRLYADPGVRKKPGAVYRSREGRADRPDVRGGRSMAVSSLACRRRPAGQRRSRERDHQRHSYSAALPDALGRGQGSSNHLSQRELPPCKTHPPALIESTEDGPSFMTATGLSAASIGAMGQPPSLELRHQPLPSFDAYEKIDPFPSLRLRPIEREVDTIPTAQLPGR